MWRDLWARLTGRGSGSNDAPQQSRAERRFAQESYEDRQADEFVGEHLGGVEPDKLRDDDGFRT